MPTGHALTSRVDKSALRVLNPVTRVRAASGIICATWVFLTAVVPRKQESAEEVLGSPRRKFPRHTLGGSFTYIFAITANPDSQTIFVGLIISQTVLGTCIEGSGKFANSLGSMVVEGSTGVKCEIGSFQLTDDQRQWIWDHRDVLTGQIAEVRAMNVNESGAIRAGVFVRFHPSRSEAGLLMYSEGLAGGDPQESRSMLYRLKSAAGWKRKV